MRALLAFARPLTQIAKALDKIAALYEADLLTRTPPVYLFSEKPSKHDTEVSYMGAEDPDEKRKSWMKGWWND